MSFCSQCGNENPENAVFCGNCGNSVNAVAASKITPTTPAISAVSAKDALNKAAPIFSAIGSFLSDDDDDDADEEEIEEEDEEVEEEEDVEEENEDETESESEEETTEEEATEENAEGESKEETKAESEKEEEIEEEDEEENADKKDKINIAKIASLAKSGAGLVSAVKSSMKKEEEEAIFCTNCGAKLPKEMAFCGNCGSSTKPIAQEAKPEAIVSEPPKPECKPEPKAEPVTFKSDAFDNMCSSKKERSGLPVPAIAGAAIAVVAIVLAVIFLGRGGSGEGGSFTDSRDSKKYKTVKIGEQIWMAKNLNDPSKGGKCYGDKPENCKKYGRLYTWEEATKACPSGWHLPSDDEWQTLVNFAGGDNVAGKKLKAKTGWNNDNECKFDGQVMDTYMVIDFCGTDDYGFSALPGGCGNSDGRIFYQVGSLGYWWSSTQNSATNAWFRFMQYGYDNVDRSGSSKSGLKSVRCLQDYTEAEKKAMKAKEDAEAKAKADAAAEASMKAPSYDADMMNMLSGLMGNEQKAAGPLIIKVDTNTIFLDGKEIADALDVAIQEDLLIKSLNNALENRGQGTDSKCQIQTDPNQYYDVLFKTIVTCGYSGYTDVRLVSEINGKNYSEQINLPEKGSQPKARKNTSNDLNLTIAMSEDYIEFWARGGSLPRIPFNQSVYDELENALAEISDKFADSPDADNVIIVADDAMKISSVIQAMRIARTNGFTKINLAKLR